jgi:hypothetical protein
VPDPAALLRAVAANHFTANTRAAAVADWILCRRPELVNQRLDGCGATLLQFSVEGDDVELL